MAKPTQAVQQLLDQGYHRYVVLFNWTYQEDPVAIDRLRQYFDKLFDGTGIDAATAQGYYLTGERTFVLIAYSKDPTGAGLQKFCSSVTFSTPIKAKICSAVEANELMKAYGTG